MDDDGKITMEKGNTKLVLEHDVVARDDGTVTLVARGQRGGKKI